MIELKHVTYQYQTGEFRLDIPHFSVSKGEKVAIIGPSGSGKTTLFNLVAGILLPSNGSVRVNGTALSDKNDSERREYRISNIGFIFQDFGLIDYLDVLDNILHPYRITTALQLDTEVREKARWFASQMGLTSRLHHYSGDLSHGERQRVAICRALLTGPALILADEATGNLDPANKGHILQLLFQAADDQDATLMAVTHDRDLVDSFDRVIDFSEFMPQEAR